MVCVWENRSGPQCRCSTSLLYPSSCRSLTHTHHTHTHTHTQSPLTCTHKDTRISMHALLPFFHPASLISSLNLADRRQVGSTSLVCSIFRSLSHTHAHTGALRQLRGRVVELRALHDAAQVERDTCTLMHKEEHFFPDCNALFTTNIK
jgi:hypothetical protein